ncbi:MAG TPA: hypothetical protein DCS63_06975 [Elusimicrobia bacterium]|nr:hypothetical protein [Elusimicrobiota bacterium]
MKKSKVLFIAAIVTVSAASVAGATGMHVDFDRGISAQPSFIESVRALDTALEVAAPVCAKTHPAGNQTATAYTGKVYLKSKQRAMKQRLIASLSTTKDSSHLKSFISNHNTVVLFDSEKIYLASGEFDVYAEIINNELLKEFLAQTPGNRGKCRLVMKYVRVCNFWVGLVCNLWELYEIYEEVCDGPDSDDTPVYPTTGGPDCSDGPQRFH